MVLGAWPSAIIACEDDGPGVPAELAPKLFAPFAQGPRVTATPQKLPEAARSVGKGMRELKESLTADDDEPDYDDEPSKAG